MTFTLLILLHIASVVVFLGNITTGLFWGAHANRSKDFRTIASTFDGIRRSDRWFTMPGVTGILIGGIGGAASVGIPILRTGWILWAIVLLSISGILFGMYVAPLQKKIQHLASSETQSTESWAAYRRLYKSWEIWGLLAWLAPVAAMVIMVTKPDLPGF